ncbi:MAG: hypothetical protein WC966_07405, partial [Bradymonadales bacterium]
MPKHTITDFFIPIEQQADTTIARSMIIEKIRLVNEESIFYSIESSIYRSFCENNPWARRNLIIFAQSYALMKNDAGLHQRIKAAYACESTNETLASILTPCTRAFLSDYGPHRRALAPEPESWVARILGKPLGVQKAMARTAKHTNLQALLRSSEPSVVQILCENPRIKEADIIFIASRQPCVYEALRCILESKHIFQYEVRSAIAHNPYLAVGDCLRLLPTLGTNTLKSLAAQNLMHPIVIST